MPVNVRLYLSWSIPRGFHVVSLRLGGVQSVLKKRCEVSGCWTTSRRRWRPSRQRAGLPLSSEALHVVVQGVGPSTSGGAGARAARAVPPRRRRPRGGPRGLGAQPRRLDDRAADRMRLRVVSPARGLLARQGPDPACLAAGGAAAPPRARGDRGPPLAGDPYDDPGGAPVHAGAHQAGGPVRARSGGSVSPQVAPDMA